MNFKKFVFAAFAVLFAASPTFAAVPQYVEGEAIVMTDIPNGTPFNCVSRLMEHHHFYHLTGMNLPMVIDVVSQVSEEAKAAALCIAAVEPAREAIIDVNAWMKELGILE